MKKVSVFKEKITFLTLSMLMALPIPAYAEEAVDTRDITITATRTEQEVKEIPSAVQIITRKELDTMGAKNLLEALRMSTSINVVSSTMVGDGITIRGMDGKYVLVLVDGQRLTSEGASTTGNAYEWSRLNLENVERIEIVRGIASSLYGSDAMGGVINIITKVPGKEEMTLSYNPARYSDDTGIGSDNISFRYDAGKKGPLAWSVSANRLTNDRLVRPGTSVSNYYGTRENVNVAASYDLGGDQQLQFKADLLQEKMQSQTSATKMGFYDNDRETYSLGLRGKRTNGDYEIRTYFGTQDKTADDYAIKTGIWTRNANVSTRKTWTTEGRTSVQLGERHLLTTGGEFRTESYEGTRVSVGKASNDYTAVYAQDEYVVNDRLLLIPSLRYDDSTKFESSLSPKVGMTYKMNNHYRLKMNAGKGFKAPSLDDLYMDMAMGGHANVIGNPDLKPEKSTNYEIGIEGEKGKSFGKLTYFINDVKDLIIYAPVVGSSDYTSKNVNKADINGLEVEFGQHIMENFMVKMNYTYLDAIDDSHERLTGRGRHQGSVQFHYDNSKKNGISAVLWNSWVQDYVYTATDHKSFNTWNITLNKKWNENLSGSIGVDNIFNKKQVNPDIWGSSLRANLTMKL